MNKKYTGVIVEESLKDNRILNYLNVKKLRITNHKNPIDRWHMYEVDVCRKEIDELSRCIIDDWYMHFWHDRDVIAVFKDSIFEFNYDNKASWDKVLQYGRLLGIPEEQLDFPIKGL